MSDNAASGCEPGKKSCRPGNARNAALATGKDKETDSTLKLLRKPGCANTLVLAY